MKIALCLLVKNEIEGCKFVVPQINRDLFEAIFAIDASDNFETKEFLESQGITVLTQETSSYNGAYIQAIKFVKFDLDVDGVVFFHPKGTISTSTLVEMSDLLKQGFDFVIASRMIKNSRNEEDGSLLKPRKWFVHLISALSVIKWSTLKKPRVTDPLHGYRGMNLRFLESLTLKTIGVSADLEMISHFYRGQFSFVEFPVREEKRIHGSTNFPAVKTGKELLLFLIKGEIK